MIRTHGPDSGHGDCFGCHVLGVNLAPSALGSVQAAQRNTNEREMTRDIGAYKALRKDGLQPKTVMGSGDLQARAEHPLEVELGRKLRPEAVEIAAEMAA